MSYVWSCANASASARAHTCWLRICDRERGTWSTCESERGHGGRASLPPHKCITNQEKTTVEHIRDTENRVESTLHRCAFFFSYIAVAVYRLCHCYCYYYYTRIVFGILVSIIIIARDRLCARARASTRLFAKICIRRCTSVHVMESEKDDTWLARARAEATLQNVSWAIRVYVMCATVLLLPLSVLLCAVSALKRAIKCRWQWHTIVAVSCDYTPYSYILFHILKTRPM